VKAATHLAFAGVCAVIAQGLGYTLEPASLVALGLGSILPDIDTSTSNIGQLVPGFSSRIERKFGHRTITHSLLGVIFLAIISSPLIFWNSSVFAFLLLGFLSHLILDTFNISGVPLLWPARTVFWFFPHRAYRVAYNSPLERLIMVSCVLACVAVMPFSSAGFSPSFHRFLGTPSGVVADYLAWRDSNEVFADVEGFNVETQEKVEGRFRVIDAIGKEGVIFEDGNGDALGMGLARGAQVSVYHTAASKGAAIQVKEFKLEIADQTIGQFLEGLPKAKRVWITANLQARDLISAPPPKVGRYPRVKSFGHTLEIRSARTSDLEPLRDVLVTRGSAIIRAETAVGEVLADVLEPVRKPQKTIMLEIPNLPTLAGLVIKPGDKVLEGQPIARYVNDTALEVQQAQLERAMLAVKSDGAELTAFKTVFASQQASLETKLASARETVKRLEFLVNAGAEPPIKLALAKSSLRELEAQNLERLSGFTSRQAALERSVQAAKLTVNGAKSARVAGLEKQWVRSPMAGLVSEVRVKSVTVKGITLEVVLLGQPASQI
jgi:membrane-bound metal-dependent hydrolase YbcI (DUF457 family)/biotin carboxyl carrier protein